MTRVYTGVLSATGNIDFSVATPEWGGGRKATVVIYKSAGLGTFSVVIQAKDPGTGAYVAVAAAKTANDVFEVLLLPNMRAAVTITDEADINVTLVTL